MRPLVGVSLMTEDAYRQAVAGLWSTGLIEAVEWTLDLGFSADGPPAWCAELLDQYARAGRLFGHCVAYSPLSGSFEARHRDFLTLAHEECSSRRYRHVSDHFGFLGGGSFSFSAPLPMPRTREMVAVGRDRLRRLATATGTPVGLENLAFAFCLGDALDQGQFLDDLLVDLDGFVLLDLHNLYCQLVNFNLDANELLRRYPLHRVREIHISGGSFSTPTVGTNRDPVRRDTHDTAIPRDVIALLPLALARCPNVEAIIIERLGATMTGAASERDEMRRDLEQIHAAVEANA
jgi:hypothetical protein